MKETFSHNQSDRLLFILRRKAFSFMRRLKRLIYRISILKFILLYDYLNSKWFHNEDTFVAFPGNTTKKNPYLCIFSHFDAHNVIDPYVIFYLQELARNGCNIIFVTTSSSLALSERNKITPYCEKIIVRRNRGRDFGAFKCGIDAINNIAQYEKIILANDSVYGPLYDLTKVLRYGDNNHLDIWGASDSLQDSYHIQSYFVVFGKHAIESPAFLQFWDTVYYLGHRQNIINHYEIGMSKYFLNKGFKLGALCNYTSIKNDLRSNPNLLNKLDTQTKKLLKKHRPLNQTHFFWNIIISDYQFPFIKRELLHYNPERLNISYWKDLLQANSHFNAELIVKHLSRLSNATESL